MIPRSKLRGASFSAGSGGGTSNLPRHETIRNYSCYSKRLPRMTCPYSETDRYTIMPTCLSLLGGGSFSCVIKVICLPHTRLVPLTKEVRNAVPHVSLSQGTTRPLSDPCHNSNWYGFCLSGTASTAVEPSCCPRRQQAWVTRLHRPKPGGELRRAVRRISDHQTRTKRDLGCIGQSAVLGHAGGKRRGPGLRLMPFPRGSGQSDH